MKRSDISDFLAVVFANAWLEDSENRSGVYASLCALEFPPKVVLAKLEHLVDRGLLEYGTSIAYAWPTEKGIAEVLMLEVEGQNE